MTKIFIELPSWLGDTLMATPAIENLTMHFSDTELTLLGSEVSIEVFKEHPRVVKTYISDKKIINFHKQSRAFGEFDIMFSFRNSFRSKYLKFLISSKKKYQFNKNIYINQHQVEKYNDFVNDSLKINYVPGTLKLHFKKNEKKSTTRILGINPGASYGSAKRWYPEEFAKVAIHLSDNYDIVILGGPKEKNIAADIEKILINNNVKNYNNLAGKTSISSLISEIGKLDLMITGDSGPMHISAALQIPTVSIFGPTDDSETSQWKNENSFIVKKNLACQPCMKRVCPLQHHDCMRMVKSKDVLDGVALIS